MSMTPNQLLPIFFKISRKVNLIFDHLKLIFPKNVIDENRFKIWFYNKKKRCPKRIYDGRWVWHTLVCSVYKKVQN